MDKERQVPRELLKNVEDREQFLPQSRARENRGRITAHIARAREGSLEKKGISRPIRAHARGKELSAPSARARERLLGLGNAVSRTAKSLFDVLRTAACEERSRP